MNCNDSSLFRPGRILLGFTAIGSAGMDNGLGTVRYAPPLVKGAQEPEHHPFGVTGVLGQPGNRKALREHANPGDLPVHGNAFGRWPVLWCGECADHIGRQEAATGGNGRHHTAHRFGVGLPGHDANGPGNEGRTEVGTSPCSITAINATCDRLSRNVARRVQSAGLSSVSITMCGPTSFVHDS
ncbi:hypothetical protein [Dactylosporangium salmoneum]|uniref:Uncharacterized protein n=1 Tax=Dactylosporangium salmoneum TaxID=53361 RepID=A0ABN3FWJ9_9ACTN